MQGSLWFPCTFFDEHEYKRINGGPEANYISRKSILQFGNKGDTPVNPDAITFLVTGKKLAIKELQTEISRTPSSAIFLQDLS